MTKAKRKGMLARRLKRIILTGFALLIVMAGVYALSRWIPAWRTNPFAGLWQGLYAFMAFSMAGFMLTGRLLYSPDNFLFGFTPLTSGLYFRRNFRRIVFLTIAIYIVTPVVLILRLPDEFRLNPLFAIDLILLFSLSFILPCREGIRGRLSLTSGFFPLRHVFRLPWGFQATAVAFFMTPRIIARAGGSVSEPFNAFYQSVTESPLVHAILLFCSPLTELVMSFGTPFGNAILAISLICFGAMVALGIRDIVRTIRANQELWERTRFEMWLDQRRMVEEHQAEADGHVAVALSVRERFLHTPETDSSARQDESREMDATETATVSPVAADTPETMTDSGLRLEYRDTCAPETQVTRHFDYFRDVSRRTGTRETLASFVRIPYVVLVTAAFIAWAAGSAKTEVRPISGWVWVIVLFFLAYNRPFRLRWCISSCLTLPLRWPRLIWSDFLCGLRRDFPLDAAAAALIVLLFRHPYWLSVIWWTFFRLVGLSAYLGAWCESLRHVGRPWPSRLSMCLAGFMRFGQFIVHLMLVIPSLDKRAPMEPQGVLVCVLLLVAMEVIFLFSVAAIIALFARKWGRTVPGHIHWPVSFLSGETHEGVSARL